MTTSRKKKPKSKKTLKTKKVKKGAKKRSLSISKKKPIKKKSVKKKPIKKKSVKKKKSTKPKTLFTARKMKPRKDIFVVEFPRGVKSEEKLNRYFDAINWKLKQFPSDQVNVTLYAKHAKETAGMTYVYDLPKSGNWVQNLDELKSIFKEMTRDIFKTKAKVKQFAGYLKEAKIKDYINRIVIDFETSKPKKWKR